MSFVRSATVAEWGIDMAHPDSLLPLSARLTARRDLTADTALFRFEMEDERASGPDGTNHRPGQFVMLSVLGVGEAPFSICQAPAGEELELTVRRVGTVTNRLFELEPGARVGLRGPYGNGFPMERMGGGHLLLVAGGLGLAPLRGVWQAAMRERGRFPRITLLYGLNRVEDQLFGDELEQLSANGVSVQRALMDGAEGAPFDAVSGHVGHLLEPISLDSNETFVACCGPPVMYEGVTELLKTKGVYPQRIFITFERRMECGIGQCGHCTIGYRYTCLDGPVFSAWEARGLREAWA